MTNVDKIQILVCCHKADNYIRTEAPYYPIQVGKDLNPELDLGFQNDNEGDNISSKNKSWCELTALYWGWKNIKNVEYLGLCHYRRYFKCELSSNNIDKLMRGKDILLVNRLSYQSNLATGFMSMVSMEDYYIFQDILLKLHPEYYDAVLKYCHKSNRFVRCTMFVAKKEIYDDFCSTFFPVFEEVEKIVRKYPFSRQNRNIGYMGELSLGIYVTYKKLKVKYVPMEILPYREHGNEISYQFHRFRCWLSNYRKVLGFKIMCQNYKKIEMYDTVVLGLKSEGIELSKL